MQFAFKQWYFLRKDLTERISAMFEMSSGLKCMILDQKYYKLLIITEFNMLTCILSTDTNCQELSNWFYNS